MTPTISACTLDAELLTEELIVGGLSSSAVREDINKRCLPRFQETKMRERNISDGLLLSPSSFCAHTLSSSLDHTPIHASHSQTRRRCPPHPDCKPLNWPNVQAPYPERAPSESILNLTQPIRSTLRRTSYQHSNNPKPSRPAPLPPLKTDPPNKPYSTY